MSTTCVVKVRGLEDIILYIHYDGYPSFMLPWLSEFNQMFYKERGVDPAYKFPQLIRFTGSEENVKKFNLNNSQSTGYAVCFSDEVQTEFEYILEDDGSVTHSQLV